MNLRSVTCSYHEEYLKANTVKLGTFQLPESKRRCQAACPGTGKTNHFPADV